MFGTHQKRPENLCLVLIRNASPKCFNPPPPSIPPLVYSGDRSKAVVVPVLVLLFCCFVVYSMRRFVLCLTLCYFVLVFFSPFSIAITSLEEERANLSAFRTFVRFVLVWFYRFPLPLGVWKGLRFVIVALPGLFSYPFFLYYRFFCEELEKIISELSFNKFSVCTYST